ncbi:alpha-ketoglutarate-dependent sulfonate dioxygenase [Penicillium taxi]|uniref:alpha-ketoglutarate-dependent sulfonate dioxygenase n=1 Tax=Penicillium taxi TaxID=168475 RepID=UPI002544EEB2|nr:alpha-ketoglutarate-dependent sulfonate dioxygenase [Penicillium taxi]KAJ5899497.1 alpha-ketoglutarate-dependent sulfonate dioxygenase [Penicillium taxi]
MEEHLESYSHISPDSGLPITLHPNFNPRINNWNPPKPLYSEFRPPKDRALFADPSKPNLFAVATPTDLTESIGTVLSNVQLSDLTLTQLDELALLVAERGVVFFRNQTLKTKQQESLFSHYGIIDRHPTQREKAHLLVKGSGHGTDTRELLNYTPWPYAGWHADASFEINPPSYCMLRMESHPPVGGDTAWVSQYGLYDALSASYKELFEGLHAVHTSRLQYDTLLDLWGVGPNRPPLDMHHPAVRTHPVTRLKALNVNEGFVTGFAELKKLESEYTYVFSNVDKLLDFALQLIHSADDHLVRWKWEAGSVAFWDNRCTLHRVVPGKYKEETRRGIRTRVLGEKPYLDPSGEGREERTTRLAEDTSNKESNEFGS